MCVWSEEYLGYEVDRLPLMFNIVLLSVSPVYHGPGHVQCGALSVPESESRSDLALSRVVTLSVFYTESVSMLHQVTKYHKNPTL